MTLSGLRHVLLLGKVELWTDLLLLKVYRQMGYNQHNCSDISLWPFYFPWQLTSLLVASHLRACHGHCQCLTISRNLSTISAHRSRLVVFSLLMVSHGQPRKGPNDHSQCPKTDLHFYCYVVFISSFAQRKGKGSTMY